MDNSPCEYCGAALPFGVDKPTRRVRSHHFQNCSMRPQREEVEQPRREWRSLLPEGEYQPHAMLVPRVGYVDVRVVQAIEAALKERNT